MGAQLTSKYLPVPSLAASVCTLPDVPPCWPEAAQMQAHLRECHRKRQELGQEIQRREAGLHWARRKDDDSAARSLLEGTPMPPSEVERLEREVKGFRSLLNAAEGNRLLAVDAFLDVIDALRDFYRQELVALIQEPVELSAAGVERLQLLLSWKAWLDRWPKKLWALQPVRVEVGMYGEKFGVQEVFRALEESVQAAVADATAEPMDTKTTEEVTA